MPTIETCQVNVGNGRNRSGKEADAYGYLAGLITFGLVEIETTFAIDDLIPFEAQELSQGHLS